MFLLHPEGKRQKIEKFKIMRGRRHGGGRGLGRRGRGRVILNVSFFVFFDVCFLESERKNIRTNRRVESWQMMISAHAQ